jgi:outer membrane protein
MVALGQHGGGNPLKTFFKAPLSGWASACIALLFCCVATVSADDGKTRIGFVDIPYLIDRAPQALEAELRLETEFAPRQAELKQQRAALAQLSAKLANASLELSESEIAQLDRETRGLERRIKRSEQDFREELNIQKNDEFKKVRILVLEAIGEFGREQDYDLIVSDGVLFANKRVDVTERILESLTKEIIRLQSAN